MLDVGGLHWNISYLLFSFIAACSVSAALIAFGLVFNAAGYKDVLLTLFNQIIGA